MDAKSRRDKSIEGLEDILLQVQKVKDSVKINQLSEYQSAVNRFEANFSNIQNEEQEEVKGDCSDLIKIESSETQIMIPPPK